jgi:hypothetical protein
MYFYCMTVCLCMTTLTEVVVVLCDVCFVTFPVLFVCICALNYCHRVATQLQLNKYIIFLVIFVVGARTLSLPLL